ncbi:MAG: 50S ribosomal protein L19 [Myxococcota bacterium]
MNLLQQLEAEMVAARERKTVDVRPGDVVKVHVKIKEGDKERIQVFEGTVIRIKNGGARATFTVRKVSAGVGVERIFPASSPNIPKIEVMIRHKVRRAKLHYLRNRTGKAARLKPVRDFKANANR